MISRTASLSLLRAFSLSTTSRACLLRRWPSLSRTQVTCLSVDFKKSSVCSRADVNSLCAVHSHEHSANFSFSARFLESLFLLRLRLRVIFYFAPECEAANEMWVDNHHQRNACHTFLLRKTRHIARSALPFPVSNWLSIPCIIPVKRRCCSCSIRAAQIPWTQMCRCLHREAGQDRELPCLNPKPISKFSLLQKDQNIRSRHNTTYTPEKINTSKYCFFKNGAGTLKIHLNHIIWKLYVYIIYCNN